MERVIALSFGEFQSELAAASQRGSIRMKHLMPLADANAVYLFGFGGKGRALAWHIRHATRTSVIVYDSSAEVRARAANEGFDVVDDLRQIDHNTHGTILGACQAQSEQASRVPNNRIYYQEAAFLFDAPHLQSKARDFSDWIMNNVAALYGVYESVDDQSKATFAGVLTFRLSLDPRALGRYRRDNSDMWFDIPERCAHRAYRTFLDVGAFDGDTLLKAHQRLGVTRGIAVEANDSLFDSIDRVGRLYENGILVLPHAAWSHKCRLQFTEVRGGMISVNEAADGQLDAAPIDDIVDEPVDMMKMDIEGAEIPALQGTRRTLRTGPDLAIAAYHRPDDLVELPHFLEKAGYGSGKFDLHVAHYSDCLDDTILYFLKRG